MNLRFSIKNHNTLIVLTIEASFMVQLMYNSHLHIVYFEWMHSAPRCENCTVEPYMSYNLYYVK